MKTIAQSKTVFASCSCYATLFHDTFDDKVQNPPNPLAVSQERGLFFKWGRKVKFI